MLATSMAQNQLQIVKGSTFDILDWTAPLSGLSASIPAGAVMTLDSSGNFVAGASFAAAKIPFYAWSGTDLNNAPDVVRTRGMPYSGAGRFRGITYKANVELQTTYFDATQSASLLPGVALTAQGTAGAQPGRIKIAIATDVVVGRVSAAGYNAGVNGYPTLNFYPEYIVGTTVPVA